MKEPEKSGADVHALTHEEHLAHLAPGKRQKQRQSALDAVPFCGLLALGRQIVRKKTERAHHDRGLRIGVHRHVAERCAPRHADVAAKAQIHFVAPGLSRAAHVHLRINDRAVQGLRRVREQRVKPDDRFGNRAVLRRCAARAHSLKNNVDCCKSHSSLQSVVPCGKADLH